LIAQRGSGGTRKGRPTNLRVPHKGSLSNSTRAIAHRDRSALLNAEGKALEAARAADRAARYNLKKRLKKTEAYNKAKENMQEEILRSEQEKLDENRYRAMKSGKLSQLFITGLYLQASAEWLEPALDIVHKKWDRIFHEVDLRKHTRALEKVSQVTTTPHTGNSSRTYTRIYSSGGVLEKIMRRTYNNGLQKLQDNSFESKEAKKEWEQ